MTPAYYWARRKSDGEICIVWVYGEPNRLLVGCARTHAPTIEMFELLGPVADSAETSRFKEDAARLVDCITRVERILDDRSYASRLNQLQAIRDALNPLPDMEIINQLDSLLELNGAQGMEILRLKAIVAGLEASSPLTAAELYNAAADDGVGT